jgi:DNA-binding GntR family transcriptional regulator
MTVNPTRTKADRVYDDMRADILSGRLPPGTRLRYAELCEHYSSSTGVLREAMLRLSEQGLVKGEPQQGFQVVELSIDDLQDLTAAREVIEGLALRHAMTEGDVEWESRIIAAHHRLSRSSMQDPTDSLRLSDQWAVEHAEFHRALLDGCRNRRLKEFASSLRDAAELYRRWSLPLGRNSGERDVSVEHDALLAAVLDRDTELAVELLTTHIRRTSNLLLEGILADSPTTATLALAASSQTGAAEE